MHTLRNIMFLAASLVMKHWHACYIAHAPYAAQTSHPNVDMQAVTMLFVWPFLHNHDYLTGLAPAHCRCLLAINCRHHPIGHAPLLRLIWPRALPTAEQDTHCLWPLQQDHLPELPVQWECTNHCWNPDQCVHLQLGSLICIKHPRCGGDRLLDSKLHHQGYRADGLHLLLDLLLEQAA